MENAELIGNAVLVVITLGSFMVVTQRLTQPVNELKVVIQELKDCIKEITKDNDTQNKRLDEHGREIDSLKLKLGNLETKMKMYHKEGGH
jgi:chromosome segregation ATPase